MRPCPVCKSNKYKLIMKQKFTIPDQWKIPNNLSLKSCTKCSMAYLDAQSASQKIYDDYYNAGQFSFVGKNDLESTDRLQSLARAIQQTCDPEKRILDIGGEDGYLKDILTSQGFYNVETCGPKSKISGHFDLLVMSHLVEHIYDMDGFFRHYQPHIKPFTRVIVEIPTWTEYPSAEEGWREYDFNLIHLNKFRPSDLVRMFSRFNFTCEKKQDLPNVRRFKCFRYQGYYTGPSNYPVIVWGLSDDVLSLVGNWNVKQYVDRSPVYRGSTINGVPILDHVTSNDPIVIGAIHSKEAIRAEIKAAGLKNEVLFI